MRGSPLISTTPGPARPNRFNRPQRFDCRRSVDLAGRAVSLSGDVPFLFDAPLAPHHRLIGEWVVSREEAARTYTRPQARRHIEGIFDAAVIDGLGDLDMVDLRVVVFYGQYGGPPAIAIVCDSIGQLDLGWIETSDAPTAWRAAAYKALAQTLGRALPIFGYQDLFDEIAVFYWDGETDDEAALQILIDHDGAGEADPDTLTLPSTMNARRPDWMIAAHAAPVKRLPNRLRAALRVLGEAYKALGAVPRDLNAWAFDFETITDYIPGIEECSTLPPLTLVPFAQFAPELDDVARHGMELGFMDVAGLCPLPHAKRIDEWFASLRLGARFLSAAQALIRLDLSDLRGSHGRP